MRPTLVLALLLAAGPGAPGTVLAGSAADFLLPRGNCRLSAGLDGQGGNMKKKSAGYIPEVELKKGADLTASSYDKTQGVDVIAAKVTVGGGPGEVEFTGTATGKGPGIEGTMNLWLSIFRYMRPDGTVNHVSGWNIALALKPGMTAIETAKAFVQYINSGTRPYRAKAAGDRDKASLIITYSATDKPGRK